VLLTLVVSASSIVLEPDGSFVVAGYD